MSSTEHLTQASYLAAAALFILSLRWLSDPKTARRGVAAGVAGMAAAIVGTLLHPEIVSFTWIVVAVVVGTAIGVPLSRVPLTAVPQRTALSHAFGGLAAGLVGTAKYMLWLQDGELTTFRTAAIALEVILGFLTFTGSLMAAGKLQEIIPTRPITYRGQNVVNLPLLAIADRRRRAARRSDPTTWQLFPVDRRALAALRRAADHADRRRRHADGDLAAELLRRALGGGDGLRAREQAADHRRRARRLVGLHPVDHHVPGDEPLVHQRAVRRVRPGAGRRPPPAKRKTVKSGDAAGRRGPARERRQRGDRARLRHGGGAGAAPRARALRPADQARRRREVRDPPGRRPHAGPHERAARRGRNPLRRARRDGRHQPAICRRPTSCSSSAPTTS